MTKPILCLDFDGVLHSYSSGWKGADVIPDPPVPGALKFMKAAAQDFEVAVFSSRSNQEGGIQAMNSWLHKWAETEYRQEYGEDWADDDPMALYWMASIKWPIAKPAAMITIDDRALTFDGTWPSLSSLKEFKPWNKR